MLIGASRRQAVIDPSSFMTQYPAYVGNEPYVFISYAHADSNMVFAEIARLNEMGANVWYDEGIAPGNEWTDEIAQALSGCSLFIVMMTNNAAQSTNVRKEIMYAIDESKPFVAIHLEETDLSGGLKLQIGSTQAILKHKMSAAEYESKVKDTLIRHGIVAGTTGDMQRTTNSDSKEHIEPQDAAGGLNGVLTSMTQSARKGKIDDSQAQTPAPSPSNDSLSTSNPTGGPIQNTNLTSSKAVGLGLLEGLFAYSSFSIAANIGRSSTPSVRISAFVLGVCLVLLIWELYCAATHRGRYVDSSQPWADYKSRAIVYGGGFIVAVFIAALVFPS